VGDGLGEWQRALRAQAGAREIFHCPQPKKASEQFIQAFGASNAIIFPHYGYNYAGATRINPPEINLGLGGDLEWDSGAWHYSSAPEDRALVPSEMIAIGDSPTFINVSMPSPNPEEVLYIAFPHIVPQFGKPGVGDWHNGRAAMVFCDGHTESANQATWIEPSDESRRRWNSDNQPHQETW